MHVQTCQAHGLDTDLQRRTRTSGLSFQLSTHRKREKRQMREMNFRALVLLLLLSLSSLILCSSSSSSSIVFTTLGRSRYAFDIFATPIASIPSSPSIAVATQNEILLTDGVSVNYNGFFPSSPTNSILYVSERDAAPTIHLNRRPLLSPTPVLSMQDRPSLSNDTLIYVSTHQPSHSARRPWTAVYSTHLPTNLTLRLTPSHLSDFSPSLSPSALYIAVASTPSWSGQVQDLPTSIHILKTQDPSHRFNIIDNAGWPCWADDSTLLFHRRDSAGWFSVYKAIIQFTQFSASVVSVSIDRITPPGFHAFTPAVSAAAPWLVAVATRRPGTQFRHIELIDLRTGDYYEVTKPIAPNSHHYNPFLSPDGARVGYHRCRGGGGGGGGGGYGSPPLLLENIRSPAPDSLSLFRIDGSFPSFSPDGRRIAFVRLPGLFVVNSDGSGDPIEVFGENAFGTAWDWKREGVIYTSYGPDFATESTRVDIISVELHENSRRPTIKKLTLNGENNAFPSPSPDGKWVVFRSGRSGHKNLYIMDAVEGEAAGLHRLTEGPWSDTMCNWSPDGNWIAFASDRDSPGSGSFTIYMVHPNGTGLRKVVHSGDGGRTNHPWFSPDSKSLVFTSDYAGVSAEPVANPHHYQPYGDIFTVNIDGSEIRRLTHNSYEDGTPTWTSVHLKPADVAESLDGNDLCIFDDCHWLATQQVLLSSA